MQFVLPYVGYDIPVTNWMLSSFRGSGHLYNVRTKELFNLNYAAGKLPIDVAMCASVCLRALGFRREGNSAVRLCSCGSVAVWLPLCVSSVCFVRVLLASFAQSHQR